MSYRYYVSKRNPVGLWLLDDYTPYQEHTGTNLAAGIRSGSTARVETTGLVSGAAWASVFAKNHQAEFDSPVFKQGQEDRPFALEAWIYPIRPTTGITQEIVNLVKNPSLEVDTTGWGANGGIQRLDDGTAPAGSWFIRHTHPDTLEGGNNCINTASSRVSVDPTKTYSSGVWIRRANVEGADRIRLVHPCYDSSGTFLGSVVANSDVALTVGEWVFAKGEGFTPLANTAECWTVGIYLKPGTQSVWTTGGIIDADGAIFVEGPTLPPYFDGDSPGAVWDGVGHNSASRMLISEGPQKILSHLGVYDGLTIDGNTIKFSTEYLTSGKAECSYTMPFLHAAHVVGHHGPTENALYINGELVSSVLLSEEQKADKYIATDGKLYSGETNSAQQVAVNGLAIYSNMAHDTIIQNYEAGRRSVPALDVAPSFGGRLIDIDYRACSVYLEREWSDDESFSEGYVQDVSIGETSVVPYYIDGVSVAGSISLAVPLDDDGGTSIYGVMVEWNGRNVTLEASTDGVTWATLRNGRLVPVVPNGMNPTDVDLEIRASFAAGLTTQEAFLESVKVVAFRDNIVNISETRKGSLAHPAVPLENYEPIEFRGNNGIALGGGSVTINPDDDVEESVQTIEMWVRHGKTEPALNVAVQNKYYWATNHNGALYRPGEWILMHYVLASPINTSITISGDCIIGQVATYPTALSQTDMQMILSSYTGVPVVRFDDSSTISVSEPTTPYALYAHDWSIDGGGG